MEDGSAPILVPRLCHIVRWPDFAGYGFNLHAEKGKAGQFIGKVDAGSPAEAAGLREGDRIVEVNGINIGNENHQQVVSRIKSGGVETRMLVVDSATDRQYRSTMTVIRGDLPEVRFMTAERDQQINTNGSIHSMGAATTTTSTAAAVASEQPTSEEPAPPAASSPTATLAASPHYPVRLCRLLKWGDFNGYGFNLHAEKDKPGQFIGAVDQDSPAQSGGLKAGDRIIEVNGENIEGQTHGGVIGKVKAGGDRVVLLVVDPEADAYYRGLGGGMQVSSTMMGVTTIDTPPTSAMARADVNNSETEVTGVDDYVNVDDINVSNLPEPNVSLSDEGLQQEGGEKETADGVMNMGEEDDDDDGLNEYETVGAVVAAQSYSPPTPPPTADQQDDLGVTSYSGYDGINGGSEVSEPEPEPEPAPPAEPEPKPVPQPEPIRAPEPEPEPAVIRSSIISTTHTSPAITSPGSPASPPPPAAAADGGLNLHLSAAEMKERLKARKKQDPRFHKQSFEAKSKMFEKL